MPFAADDLDGGFGAAVQVLEAQVGVGEVLSTPLEHRPHHGHEIGTGVGEDVLVANPLAGVAVGPFGQQAGGDEF